MNEKWVYLLGVCILFLAVDLNAQSVEMENNTNRIDNDFVLFSGLKSKIIREGKAESGGVLYLEKTSDGLYSIYFLNNTSDTLKISKQDEQLYLIQEAQDQNGHWKPIEYWKYSWCANSFLSVTLEPGGVLKTNSKVYKGNFETQIRFKLLNGNTQYYSNVLTSAVTSSQFEIPENLTDNLSHKRIETRAGFEILKKIIFLEPHALEELREQESAYLEKMIKSRENKD